MSGRVLRFDEFMELALYDPQTGFFAGEGSAVGAAGTVGTVGVGAAGGAHGDFITSPEVGPLFGQLVGRYLDQCWISAGRPGTFDVVEYGAGRGALAITVRAGSPECLRAGALRYHMVELSERLRSNQHEYLPSVDVNGEWDESLDGECFSHKGFASLPQRVDVVFANELLDNIPFRIFERSTDRWIEVFATQREGQSAAGGVVGGTVGEWSEQVGPSDQASSDRASGDETPDDRASDDETPESMLLDVLAPDAPIGSRVPLQRLAWEWLRQALMMVEPDEWSPHSGTVVVIDYARSTAEMAAVGADEWLRTYRAHERGGSPFDAPGSQDITADVALDQLSLIFEPAYELTQDEWLSELGIDDLVEEGRRIWKESAAAPDLAAIRARSRISEAEALCDPMGLGGFSVMIWRH